LASDDDNTLKRLTVRELRERAVKSLGSKAAGLKTKQELIDALTGDDWGTAAEVKPRRGKKANPGPAAPARPLPVARDFFVDPKKPALPTSYGDDRILVFRREPLAVVVSWDLSAGSWADGQGLWLELIQPRGKLVARFDVALQTGIAAFEELPQGVPLVPQVVRKGRVMTRGRAFSLGPLIEDELRYQMTVLWGEPLPSAVELEELEDVQVEVTRPATRNARRRRTVASLPTSDVRRRSPSSRV
jgi:hypothetical protein